MGANFHQVVAMTYEEQVEMYDKLPKEELIKMLIEANRHISIMPVVPNIIITMPTQGGCNHQWFSIPSLYTGIFRFRCMKCYAVKESSHADCITTNSYQQITNR